MQTVSGAGEVQVKEEASECIVISCSILYNSSANWNPTTPANFFVSQK